MFLVALVACASCSSSGDGGEGTSCVSTADTCTGDDICIDSQCEPALPRGYVISNISVMVPTTNPNTGEDWDVGGGAPDLFITDGSDNRLTATVQDSFTASWPGPIDVQLVENGALTLEVWDDDITANDAAFTCAADPVTAAFLRGRSIDCEIDGCSLTASIDPSE